MSAARERIEAIVMECCDGDPPNGLINQLAAALADARREGRLQGQVLVAQEFRRLSRRGTPEGFARLAETIDLEIVLSEMRRGDRGAVAFDAYRDNVAQRALLFAPVDPGPKEEDNA